MGRNPGAISFSAVIRGGERAERNAYRNGHSHPAIEHGHTLPGRPAGLRDSSPSRSGPRGATVMLRGLRPVLYGYSPSMRWWGSSARAGRTRHRPSLYPYTTPSKLPGMRGNPTYGQAQENRTAPVHHPAFVQKFGRDPARYGTPIRRISRDKPARTVKEIEASPSPAQRHEPHAPAAPASDRLEGTPGPNRSQKAPPK